jgi:hypothetical protein
VRDEVPIEILARKSAIVSSVGSAAYIASYAGEIVPLSLLQYVLICGVV